MNTKHTPTPWRVRDDGKEWALIGAEPSWITSIDKRNHDAEANAAFIVRACNAHDELVTLLETGHALMPLGTGARAKWVESVETALAKARGEA